MVDAAHGAAYHVAPDVFHELGADVEKIGCSPNGTNINAGFGATAPQALVKAVAAAGADYGIALDGDADRLQLFPQVLINVHVAAGSDHRSNARLIEAKAGVETELADAGRVLIRASGTEPVLRVMVEARDAAQARSRADRLADAIRG